MQNKVSMRTQDINKFVTVLYRLLTVHISFMFIFYEAVASGFAIGSVIDQANLKKTK